MTVDGASVCFVVVAADGMLRRWRSCWISDTVRDVGCGMWC